MKTAIRVLAGIVVVALLAIAGLSAFVHFYLTGDRLEAMLLPQAQKALGRDVTIGRIKVSLFQGITVDGFTVKEPDGKQDFVSTGKFILRYDLMPLLQKKLVVSEIRLEKPSVRVFRDDKGRFNFSSLAVLSKKEGAKKGSQEKTSAPAEALPLALTVDKISVQKAHLLFSDAKGELPAVDALADVNVGLDLAQSMDSLRFQGDGKFELTTVYQGLEPHIKGTMKFSEQQLASQVEIAVQDEKISIDSKIDNYRNTPAVELNAASKQLNIDKLLAMAGALSGQETGKKAGGKKKTTAAGRKKGSKKALAKNLPPGLTAHGQVEVEKATYQGLEMSNLHLVYRLENNILTVEELTADTAEGSIATNLTVDLNDPDLGYKGKLALKAVQLALLQDAFFPNISEKLSGGLSTDVSYSGSGMEWPVMRDRLSADGEFSLQDGKILNSDVANSIADLLGLPELKDFVFSNLSGNVKVSEGDVNLTSSMAGRDMDMEAAGIIGLDKTLDLPLTLQLSPELSQKMQKKSSLVKYLSNEKGRTTVRMKVAGTLDKPRPALDTASVQKQVTDTLLNKALGELDRSSDQDAAGTKEDQQKAPQPSLEETGKGLLKGLFGK